MKEDKSNHQPNRQFIEPRNFNEMMRRPEEEERKKWLEGCTKEILNFNKREVYEVISLEEVPEGRKLIGSKWVFKLKRNGTYRSRLVALGYSQVPFIDFTDCYSPTVSESTMRICIMVCVY